MRVMRALIILCASVGSSASNILVFLPNNVWSHYKQVTHIFYALAERGHNITIYSPFPPAEGTPNTTHVRLVGNAFLDSFKDIFDVLQPFSRVLSKKHFADHVGPKILPSPVFQDLIHSDSNFDLIFLELFSGLEVFVVLGSIFNAPVVAYSSYGYNPQILQVTGAGNAPAYLPHKLDTDFAGHLSLWERMTNSLLYFLRIVFNEYWYYPAHDDLVSEYIPGQHPRISDMLRNVSLFFFTEHPVTDGSKLYPPNVVEISGTYMPHSKPLDQDLQSILDDAHKGLIYFSLGSMASISLFSDENIKALLHVLGSLERPVLFKADLNASDWNIPRNIQMKEWFDQTSILAHPNCALFITHGGISSYMEAIQYSVPMVAVPFFSDQAHQAANIELRGYGLRLDPKNVTEKSLRWAITTVLEEPRFQENIRVASKIFQDKPMSSINTAVYWTEYVIRHHGAHYLKATASEMPWYQLLLLDVILLMLCIVLFCLIVFIVLLCSLYKSALRWKKLLFRKFKSQKLKEQ